MNYSYDGTPLMKSGQNNMIFVAPNYRMGAFGFLAGPTVEAQGTPNAGLWDQRAALEWVQNYIGLVGGDKNAVTAMGESAGAGSITHHLIGNGGTLDPLFRRAIISSPAWLPQYDSGYLETQYASFAVRAGCANQGLACLRGKPTEVLDRASRDVILSQPYGTFGFGPAVDGSFIRDLPTMELSKGNHWKDMNIIVGHNSNEGIIFTSTLPASNAQVRQLVKTTFQNATDATIDRILNLYPEPGLFKKYISNFARSADLIGQFIVSCNTRYLAKAYAGKAYNYQFSVIPGIHAMDLLFTFWRPGLNIGPIEIDFSLDFLTSKNLATGWQSYLTSFVRAGDPNTHRERGGLPPTRDWPKSTVGSKVQLLDMDLLGFSVEGGDDTDAGRCDFWEAGVWTGRA